MARQYRSHSVAFKRQVAEEFLAGETLHGLAKRHDLCRNLSRVWVAKYEAGGFDDDAGAADLFRPMKPGSPHSSGWSASRHSSSSFQSGHRQAQRARKTRLHP
jgi:hypothetical protein